MLIGRLDKLTAAFEWEVSNHALGKPVDIPALFAIINELLVEVEASFDKDDEIGKLETERNELETRVESFKDVTADMKKILRGDKLPDLQTRANLIKDIDNCI